MQQKQVKVVQPKIELKIDAMTNEIRKKRLCGYVRVSTDSEDQKTSFETQYEEYYNRINSNPEWEFVFHLIPPAHTCIITKYNF